MLGATLGRIGILGMNVALSKGEWGLKLSVDGVSGGDFPLTLILIW